ncbi:hypothetical protein M3Y99_01228900 [Aphelenchoides fujianensis]|nr:hypothetical protein M3Y99_01228900 [Aphelenchoides fujianensis]
MSAFSSALIVLFLFVTAGIQAASLPARPVHPKLLKVVASNDAPLCDACLEFFTSLKADLGDVSELTKDRLATALQDTCTLLEDQGLTFVEKICDNFGPALIDLLFDYLTEVDKAIVPEHDCKLLFLCPFDQTAHKHALQQLIVEKKLRFD